MTKIYTNGFVGHLGDDTKEQLTPDNGKLEFQKN